MPKKWWNRLERQFRSKTTDEIKVANPNINMDLHPPPRPLHVSRSASNAAINELPEISRTLPTLHKSASVRDTDSFPSLMDHRTLKPTQSRATPEYVRAQHMQSLHELVQSIEGFQNPPSDRGLKFKNNFPKAMTNSMMVCNESSERLPPPAKLLPFSGMKPHDNDIMRPIAFRPVASKVLKRTENRLSNSPDINGLDIKPFNLKAKLGNKDHSKSIGNLASTTISTEVTNAPSTSGQLFSGKSIGSLPQADENDYDTVSDYIDRKQPADEHSHHYTQFNNHGPRSHSLAGRRSNTTTFFNFNTHTNGSTSSQFTSSSTSSNSTTHSPSSNGLKKCNSSSQNIQRNSNGVHITPSPSDSGIVDYESLIRDKENELTSVRQAMEQNEEVLIRVYQDKERQYKDQIHELGQKLHMAQQNEQMLRQQLKNSDDHRQFLQKSVKSLGDEKIIMQRKCGQIERELQLLKQRMDTMGNCENCKSHRPIPAPRSIKENDRELRTEVDDLKGEVSTLRQQLNQQMQLFSEERRRWDADRNGNDITSKATHFGITNQLTRQKPVISADRLI